MDTAAIYSIGGAFLLGLILFVMINLKTGAGRRKSLSAKDEGYVKQKWADIERMVASRTPSQFQHAVTEADKVCDFVLEKMGAKGEKMADRMKDFQKKFSSWDAYQDFWAAHKVRNRILHDMENEVREYEAKQTIEKFRKVLKELRVL